MGKSLPDPRRDRRMRVNCDPVIIRNGASYRRISGRGALVSSMDGLGTGQATEHAGPDPARRKKRCSSATQAPGVWRRHCRRPVGRSARCRTRPNTLRAGGAGSACANFSLIRGHEAAIFCEKKFAEELEVLNS